MACVIVAEKCVSFVYQETEEKLLRERFRAQGEGGAAAGRGERGLGPERHHAGDGVHGEALGSARVLRPCPAERRPPVESFVILIILTAHISLSLP